MLLTSLLCTSCIPAAEIPDIPVAETLEDFGQVQYLLFQRIKNGTADNGINTGTGNPELKASWTPLTTASDATKVTVSPPVQEPAFEPGEPREVGGGNATLDGIPIIKGSNPTSFTGMFKRVPQAVIKEIKKYQCETSVGVYLVNECGHIAGQQDGDLFKPFPIRQFFTSDKRIGGFDEVDANAVRFQFPPNWSNDWKTVVPSDFDPRTDLTA